MLQIHNQLLLIIMNVGLVHLHIVLGTLRALTGVIVLIQLLVLVASLDILEGIMNRVPVRQPSEVPLVLAVTVLALRLKLARRRTVGSLTDLLRLVHLAHIGLVLLLLKGLSGTRDS